VLWSLAARHFGGRAVALVGVALLVVASFWLEYVHAIWPHSVSVLCVTAAFLLILEGLDGGPGLGLKSLAAGAVVGVGFLFRTDSVLAIPAIGLIAILLAERPFRMGAFFGLGLAPFVALACAVNEAKFGTLNPLSYGQSGGNTDLSAHLPAIAALAFVSLVLVGSRFTRWRPGRREYAIGLVALVLVVVFSATLRDLAQRYLSGAWALAVDATTVHDPRPGVQHQPGGVLTFWGLWKKALGQSMPWLGLLFLAAHMRQDAGLRRSQGAVLILAAVWSLPFFMTDWHGGMGSNMRYLLPLVPALCALSARYLLDFARPIENAPRIFLLGAWAGALAVALWGALAPTGGGGAQQILSTWILAAVAALALLSGLRWRGQGVVRVACLGVIGAALAASASYLLSDIRQAQHVRADAQARSLAMADLPDRTLAYAPPAFVTYWGLQPGHILAMPDDHHIFDTALIDQALADGYRVLVAPPYATRRLRAHYGPRLVDSGLPFAGGGKFLEVKVAG
jgi:general stress protein CsbA